MCALYFRCALSVLQKECRKVWGARYTLGARYRSENTVLWHTITYWPHKLKILNISVLGALSILLLKHNCIDKQLLTLGCRYPNKLGYMNTLVL